MNCPRIVIAGTHSGVGKTSVTLAVVAALRKRGYRVQTFKVGPDFLDPSYLAMASGMPCYNLDGWMSGRDYVCRLFARVSERADISVIEGVMGLFDGADPDNSEGSTAEIARWLDAPVLLVADVYGIARSIAAVVKGYTDFEPGLKIAGVIANRCGSEGHALWLSESLTAASLPPLAGAIPMDGFPHLPSRHLGLVTADTVNLSRSVLDELADSFENHASVDAVVATARNAPFLEVKSVISLPPKQSKRISIGVAHDAAFHFYYRDFFDELEMLGCMLKFFSPISDIRLPEGIDALYIGGGYPEEHAESLAANEEMRSDIRKFSSSGRPVYGECGGLMYLSRVLETKDGNKYPMVGMIPASTRMLDRLKSLAYVDVTLNADSLWGIRGATLRGHEFHYSELTADPTENTEWTTVYTLKRRRSADTIQEGIHRGNILASYVHLHLASRPEALRYFINKIS